MQHYVEESVAVKTPTKFPLNVSVGRRARGHLLWFCKSTYNYTCIIFILPVNTCSMHFDHCVSKTVLNAYMYFILC